MRATQVHVRIPGSGWCRWEDAYDVAEEGAALDMAIDCGEGTVIVMIGFPSYVPEYGIVRDGEVYPCTAEEAGIRPGV